MVLSTKQKKVINIILVVAVVAIILSGIGIGIYFICKDRVELTASQKKFATEINLSVGKTKREEIGLTNFSDSFNKSDVYYLDDKYVLTSENGSNIIYDISSGNKVEISGLVVYDEIIDVCGNYLVVSYESEKKLVDLSTGKLVCSLSKANYVFNGNYILATSNKGEVLKYLPENETELVYVALLFDANENKLVYSIKMSDSVIDISLNDNYLVVSYVEKTELYALDNFKLIYTFSNEGQSSNLKYNIESFIKEDSYFMQTYYRVFELSQNVLLVEKATTNDVNVIVSSENSDGSVQGYHLYTRFMMLYLASFLNLNQMAKF